MTLMILDHDVDDVHGIDDVDFSIPIGVRLLDKESLHFFAQERIHSHHHVGDIHVAIVVDIPHQECLSDVDVEGSIGAVVVLVVLGIVLYLINRNRPEKNDLWKEETVS